MTGKNSEEKQRFKDEDRRRILLWCERHCCVCNKQCDALIEIHHIEGGSSDIDNALPVCFDCHAKVAHYNDNHPKGTKISPEELKARRNQIYDEHTRHLVPPLHFSVVSHAKPFPEIGFMLSHKGNALPIRVRVEFGVRQAGKTIAIPKEQRFYTGERLWNLNPGLTQSGHFTLPLDPEANDVEIIVSLTIIDQYEYEHEWLPVAWEFFRRTSGDYWALSPSPKAK